MSAGPFDEHINWMGELMGRCRDKFRVVFFETAFKW